MKCMVFAVLAAGSTWFAAPAAEKTAKRPKAPSIRPSAVAGQFYPGNAGQLKGAVEAFLSDAPAGRNVRPVAIVVPHAGYAYSGQIAADSWKQASGFDYDVIVILGTNHHAYPFKGLSVYPGEGYRTPLGVVKIDEALVKKLSAADKAVTYNPGAHSKEHSIEVQLPFAQVLFPGVKILPVIVGSSDVKAAEHFGHVLAGVLKARKALIVASSDLSHYPDYRDAEDVDRQTLKAMAGLNPDVFATVTDHLLGEKRRNLVTCACGKGPVITAMTAAKDLGAGKGRVIAYANSGDTVVGNYERDVGYGAVVFTREKGPPDLTVLERKKFPEVAKLTEDDKRYLLKLARETIEQYMSTDTFPLPLKNTPGLAQKRGAFVTLTEKGELRGCIGRMVGDMPLSLAVARMAIAAALNDRRFEPVRLHEVKDIKIEISVLTPFRKISGPGSIRIGTDGVLLRKGTHSAVYLPQVAPHEGWGVEETLDHLCRKAGLASSCWRSGCELYTFQAEVFSEKKHHR